MGKDERIFFKANTAVNFINVDPNTAVYIQKSEYIYIWVCVYTYKYRCIPYKSNFGVCTSVFGSNFIRYTAVYAQNFFVLTSLSLKL